MSSSAHDPPPGTSTSSVGSTIRVTVTVRFPGLPRVSDLEFDAAWPVEHLQRWLALARLVLSADAPVCVPPSVPSPLTSPAPPGATVKPVPDPPVQRFTPVVTPCGDDLRRWRLRSGLSQTQIAAAAGLSRSTVSALERGRRAGPLTGTSRTLLARTLAHLTPTPPGGTVGIPGASTPSHGRRP